MTQQIQHSENQQESTLRPIVPLNFEQITKAEIIGNPPKPIFVAFSQLLVDNKYQRDISSTSLNLIKKIIVEFSWSAYKPPIVVQDGEFYHIIDGQHTAIAAASHGGIEKLLVLQIDAKNIQSRAKSFVDHNINKIKVSAMQLHCARLAAGDEDALTVEQVCQRAGVKILKTSRKGNLIENNETIAISSLYNMVNRCYAKGAREVLETCIKSGLLLTHNNIRAIEHLMFGKEYKGKYTAEQIITIVQKYYSNLELQGKRMSAEYHMPNWKGFASAINYYGGKK